jgi:putative transposase
MLWFVIAHLLTTLLAWLSIGRRSNQEKDLAILVLRQQVRMQERQLAKPVRPSRIEKLTLAVVTDKLKVVGRRPAAGLRDVLLLFQPETVLKRQRELVKRKWTFQQRAKVGRPRIETELEALIVRLANENPGLGFEKLQGELLKLGYDVAISTVRDVLKRHHIPPAPGHRSGHSRPSRTAQPTPTRGRDRRLASAVWLAS